MKLEAGRWKREAGRWKLEGHLGAPGFDVAPVWDVAEVDHERYVHHRVAQRAAAEAPRELPHQIARQEAAVRAADHRHPPLIHQTWKKCTRCVCHVPF